MKKMQVTVELPNDFQYWDCSRCPFSYTEYFEDYDGEWEWIDQCVFDYSGCELEEQRVLEQRNVRKVNNNGITANT